MRTTISDVRSWKKSGTRFATLTAYDASMAAIVEAAGVRLILVGDSLGMVFQGHDSTIPVTLDDIVYHTRAVVRGTKTALVVSDLPFLTYHKSPEQALDSAGRCIQEGGAQAVKLEGGRTVAATVKRLTDAGIPVLGHIGLTPQSIHQLGGYGTQGKTASQAKALLDDAQSLNDAGAFAVVLECVPSELAALLTHSISIPTIGIGAGPDCDGQIQVIHDILGLFAGFVPRHAKQYATLADTARQAIERYAAEVEGHAFPDGQHSVAMKPDALETLREQIQDLE